MISVTNPIFWESTKTGSLSGGHCKSCIKSIHEANALAFSTNRATILFFVTENFHEFSFVICATIGLARKNLPNVNQFFESLYMNASCEDFCTCLL